MSVSLQLSDVSKRMLAVLILVVAGAGGFVGLLYGGGVPLGRTTTETQFSIITHEQFYYMTQSVTQWVTQTVTQQTARTAGTTQRTTSSLPAGTPYVLVTYTAYGAWNELAGETAPSGFTFLVLTITVENHGYDRVYVSPSEFYVIIGSQQFEWETSTLMLATPLPTGYVFNGLSVTGYVIYQVPIDYGTFTLFWNHPSDVNVQYVPESQVNIQTTTTQQAQEQVIMEAYDWTNPSYLIITLRNVGPTAVTFSEFFLNGVRQNTFSGNCPVGSGKLPPQQKCSVSITVTAVGVTAGGSYPLKIVTIGNSVFSYSVIVGSSA